MTNVGTQSHIINAWTLEIHGFELVPKTLWIRGFSLNFNNCIKLGETSSNCIKINQIELDWFKLDLFGSNWICLVQIGSNYFKLDQNSTNWFR